ncbi:hypothetical protein CPB83DRAFT_890511 [Crepidotus variabilis]|uniref:Uncharacterized protein n=1 Tax=Crepidotus variabilis TaxID=179855 RepID=A0A9P6EQ40_9AGAR|nr:hypothetical protein CPB83DRAFT_890511 [Crepidotus variabilis]
MSTSCVSSPTRTQTGVTTSTSLSLFPTKSVTTLPGTVVTTTIQTCLPRSSGASGSGCVSTSIPTTISQPGGTSTVDVTITSTIDVSVTTLLTLFGSSCTVISTASSDKPTSQETITSTPPVSTFVTDTTVSSDGSTWVSSYVATSTPPPIVTTLPTTQTDKANNKSQPNIGAIVGGTIGGVIVLVLLVVLTFRVIKNSRRFDEFFNKDDESAAYVKPKRDYVPDKPSPYQYGVVGQRGTNPTGMSPPSSPLLKPTSLGGNEAYNAPNQAPSHHARNPSQTPLLVGAMAAAGAGVIAGSGHSRPNTASSTGRISATGSEVLNSGPPVAHAAPQQTMGYPPQPQPSNFNSYPPALANYAQHQQQPQLMPKPNLGHNPSVASSATSASLYSSASYAAPSTYTGSSAGPSSGPSGSNMAGFVPMGAAAAGLSRPGPSQSPPQPQQTQQYEDPFARASSPVIAQQQRTQLAVRNTSPEPAEGSSSGVGRVRVTDGKGRPLNTRGEKAALVHLDGGAFQGRTQTPAPPAYME